MKQYPTAGDAVRLTGPWSSVKAGQIGIINGIVGERYDEVEITWNYSAFRGYSSYGAVYCQVKRPEGMTDFREMVSCSGGPGVMSLPTKLLKPTKQDEIVNFWCWHDFPRAHSGVHYQVRVPVWEWDGRK